MSGENWDQLDEAAYARMLIKEQYFGDLDFFRTSNEIPGCDKVIGPDFPGYGTSRRGIAILVIAGNCHAWPPLGNNLPAAIQGVPLRSLDIHFNKINPRQFQARIN